MCSTKCLQKVSITVRELNKVTSEVLVISRVSVKGNSNRGQVSGAQHCMQCLRAVSCWILSTALGGRCFTHKGSNLLAHSSDSSPHLSLAKPVHENATTDCRSVSPSLHKASGQPTVLPKGHLANIGSQVPHLWHDNSLFSQGCCPGFRTHLRCVT